MFVVWRGLLRIPDGYSITFYIAFRLLGADVRALGAGSAGDLYHTCGTMTLQRLFRERYSHHPYKDDITPVELCGVNLTRPELRISESHFYDDESECACVSPLRRYSGAIYGCVGSFRFPCVPSTGFSDPNMRQRVLSLPQTLFGCSQHRQRQLYSRAPAIEAPLGGLCILDAQSHRTFSRD
jgi:hypothetical protein